MHVSVVQYDELLTRSQKDTGSLLRLGMLFFKVYTKNRFFGSKKHKLSNVHVFK